MLAYATSVSLPMVAATSAAGRKKAFVGSLVVLGAWVEADVASNIIIVIPARTLRILTSCGAHLSIAIRATRARVARAKDSHAGHNEYKIHAMSRMAVQCS